MNEQFENINPWAEKLQEVTIPDFPPSWQAMQALLDNEMPVTKSKEWRRWLLLIILLLLLIGVCNCPGALRLNRFAQKNEMPDHNPTANNNNETKIKSNHSSINKSDSTRMDNGSRTENNDSLSILTDSKGTNNVKELSNKNKSSKILRSTSLKEEDLISGNKKEISSNKQEKNKFKKDISIESSRTSSTKKINQVSGNHLKKKKSSVNNDKKINESATDTKRDKNIIQKEPKSNEPIEQESIISNNDSLVIKSISEKAVSDSIKKSAKADSSNKKQQTTATQQKDSVAKKIMKADSIEDAKGFLFAIGLNQFFPVGSQEKSNFNSSGTSGGIGDYIPIPVARYYFHKWFYVQAEAQFNTPQYTKTLLADQSVASNPSGLDTSKSVFIKKLFYFNIPLSVHYSPLKNLYVGAGLQFSMLTNGVALFQDAKGSPQGPVVISPSDTMLISSKIASFKKDPAYHQLKTSEFRFLVDINYQWKPLTLGLRYNQAFSNFINVHISNTIITQAHNASLQLYLRYTIWDHRKKFFISK